MFDRTFSTQYPMLRSQSIYNFSDRNNSGLFSFKRKTLRESASLQSLNSVDKSDRVLSNISNTNFSKLDKKAVRRPDSFYRHAIKTDSDIPQMKSLTRSTRVSNLNRKSMLLPQRSPTNESSHSTTDTLPSPTTETETSPITVTSSDSLLDQTSVQFLDFENDIEYDNDKRKFSSISSDSARKSLELEQLEQSRLSDLLSGEGTFTSNVSIIGNAVLVTTTDAEYRLDYGMDLMEVDFGKVLMEEDYNVSIEV